MTTMDMREWAKTGDHYIIDYKKSKNAKMEKRERST